MIAFLKIMIVIATLVLCVTAPSLWISPALVGVALITCILY